MQASIDRYEGREHLEDLGLLRGRTRDADVLHMADVRRALLRASVRIERQRATEQRRAARSPAGDMSTSIGESVKAQILAAGEGSTWRLSVHGRRRCT